MNTKTKQVYYCDHCKKHTLSASATLIHEKHCTNNPSRECRVCGAKTMPTVDLRTVRSIDDLSQDIECPVCAFAILRQRKLYLKKGFEGGFDLTGKTLEYWEQKRNDEEYAELQSTY